MANSIKLWDSQKLIERAISNKNTNAYWNKIHELRKRGTQEIYRDAIRLTKSRDLKRKNTGVDILAQLGAPDLTYSKDVSTLFLKMLERERDAKTLNSLLVGLGHNHKHITSRDVAFLKQFQEHENSDVRFGLVYALMYKSYSNSISTLINLSADKSKPVRDWATFALGTQIEKSTKAIRNALWSRIINDKDQDTRLEAILGLAKRKDPDITDVIIEELKKGEYGTLLFESVLEVGNIDFLKYLNRNLKRLKGEDNINPEWIKDLKECIKELKKMNKT